MAETKKKTSTSSRSSSGSTRSRAKTQAEKEKLKAEEAKKKEELLKKKMIHDDIVAIVIIVVGVFLLLSLFGYTGMVGELLSKFLFGLFGKIIAWVVSAFLILYGILIFARKTAYLTTRTWVSLLLLFVFLASLAAIPDARAYGAGLAESGAGFKYTDLSDFYKNGATGGGLIGTPIAYGMMKLLGEVGFILIAVAIVLIAMLFIFNSPISGLLDNMRLKRQARKALRAQEAELAESYQETFDLEKQNKIKTQVATEAAQRAAQEAERAAAEEALEERKRERAEAKSNAFAVAAMEAQGFGPAVKSESGKGLTDLENNAVAAANKTAETPAEYDDISASTKKPEASDPGRYKSPVQDFDKDHRSVPAEEPAPKPEEIYPDNQQKILDYVNDDSLFKVGKKTGLGLNGETAKQEEEEISQETAAPKPQKTKVDKEKVQEEAKEIAQQIASDKAEEPQGYAYPPIDLLKKPLGSKTQSSDDTGSQAQILEDALASFGVRANVVNVVKGPAVTRFEVQPQAGVKVSSIVRLQDDIALNLRAKSLRIEAPIPGKAAVGIEVSNNEIQTVLLREVLDSNEFKSAKSKISVGLGRSISGENVVADLKKMPHLLIAGATGSGKSVCINSIIISLLYKSSPEEVKMILVDPKVVELSNYNGIPHLMIPVVTDPNKAAAALSWAVAEMNDRYNKFSEEGVRDLQSYNDLMRANSDNDKIMPQIVIIVDELADLMMSAQNSVEDSICRLAQKARAAGMHLILATQRPSVDVITGVIKANIPSRIAFAVSSHVDSRTILDEAGAEKLLGRGDMLYAPQGESKPIRVQGCFVSDGEVNAVIDYVKNHSQKHEYSQNVITAMDKVAAGPATGGGSDEDELLADAIDFAVRSEQCSVSMLQRRFRIGYNRAARLVDMMEEKGIVGPADGSKPRKVLMTQAQLDAGSDAEVEEEID